MTRKTRNISQRWVIKGTLEFTTPTHLSNGDADPGVDLTLITDPLDGRALLTGASLAGAMRHYLNEYGDGYSQQYDPRTDQMIVREDAKSPAIDLFGVSRGDTEGTQSALIVEDARGRASRPRLELRDGVRIDPKTRTAEDKKKFDLQLLAAGNSFDIGFELAITREMDVKRVTNALAVVLHGLEKEEIHLGGRKRRGYGRCRVTNWQLWQYKLDTKEGLKGWLAHERGWAESQTAHQSGAHILPLLGVSQNDLGDQRKRFTVDATFAIDGSILIRSGFEGDAGPDTSHLSSWRPGEKDPVPVLSGTSLAGVIRAQALRIAHTVSGSETQAYAFVDNLFGYMSEPDETDQVRKASRVIVEETAINGGTPLVQSRVAIDRFTGGAFESALFAEQPHFGGQAKIQFVLKEPDDAEIGLLLLVLKDLWTGLTPVGGEASVGRGRLKGETADLQHTDTGQQWTITANGQDLAIQGDGAAALEKYVKAFVNKMEGTA